MDIAATRQYREVSESRRREALAKGYKHRHFFAHSFRLLPKCGPDGFRLAARMGLTSDPDRHWELVLYASSDALKGIPAELFADDDLMWHQQQFGGIGQVATANIVVDGLRAFTFVHLSDLVQRISRRREHKTRIEKRFKGWHHMLLNSLCNFALERGCREVLVPTADLAIAHTALFRSVGRQLFDRLYDRNVQTVFAVERRQDWWVVNLERNRDRIVLAERKQESVPRRKRICVCHDIEGGLGHRSVDSAFAHRADRASPGAVARMLEIEARAGVKATYHVVGTLLPSLRRMIEGRQHCLAFHSYDHQVERRSHARALMEWAAGRIVGRDLWQPVTPSLHQLSRCRRIDYRLKGYRPPQSRVTSELVPPNLCHHNFEWLASSERSLGLAVPSLAHRIVYIPIQFDDWKLYRGAIEYRAWEELAIATISSSEFVAFSLHDCYSDLWLPFYDAFLDKIQDLGAFATLDEAAADVLLDAAA